MYRLIIMLNIWIIGYNTILLCIDDNVQKLSWKYFKTF